MRAKCLVIQILFFVFFSSFAFSQPNWFWQNPFPTGNNLKDLQFIDLHTGYAAGDLFTFLKTTNSGENWSLSHMNIDTVPSGLTGNLNSISFVNSFTGYVSSGNFILKTVDGGENWICKYIGEPINSIYFTSVDTGYAACYSGKILKTVNQGNSWFIQYSNNVSVNKIYFVSSNTGFAVGRNRIILKTTNGGDNWVLKFSSSGFDLFDINFVDSSNGYAGGSFGYFYKTNNGGETWQDLRDSQLGYIRNVNFLSIDTGYLVADNGYKMYKTTNGGEDWTLLLDLGLQISKHVTLKNDNFIISCSGGNIYKSTNAGVGWESKIKSITLSSLRSISFVSESNGFICGYGNVILKTTTGGSEWEIQNPPAVSENYNYIKFFDNQNGYVAGANLYKTMNGGLNWTNLLSLENLRYIKFHNKDTGYIVRSETPFENFILYKTFDGGSNWEKLGMIEDFTSMCFLQDNNFGYALNSYRNGIPPAVYYFNDIYKTTNNGINWTLVTHFSNGLGGSFYGQISFLNESTGFIYGGFLGMKKTTNGGVSWVTISSRADSEIFFCNQSVAYSFDNYHLSINKTTDSGNNWASISQTSNIINSFFFKDNNIGYAVGDLGNILKTTNGGGIYVNVNGENEIIPSFINLYQNYPNPFNPVTKIKFDLVINGKVKLTVYNVLGKVIITILNTELPAGRYAYEFDGSNLSSGIYFYRLETENFSQTKRMVLIK